MYLLHLLIPSLVNDAYNNEWLVRSQRIRTMLKRSPFRCTFLLSHLLKTKAVICQSINGTRDLFPCDSVGPWSCPCADRVLNSTIYINEIDRSSTSIARSIEYGQQEIIRTQCRRREYRQPRQRRRHWCICNKVFSSVEMPQNPPEKGY